MHLIDPETGQNEEVMLVSDFNELYFKLSKELEDLRAQVESLRYGVGY